MTDNTTDAQATKVAALAASQFDATVAQLSEYLTFPAISCEAEHADDVHRLAQRVCGDLKSSGLNEELAALEELVR